MIDRQCAGLLPAQAAHRAARSETASSSTRRCTRAAASAAPFTYFYHRYPVTPHTRGRDDASAAARRPSPKTPTASVPASPAPVPVRPHPRGRAAPRPARRRSSSTTTSRCSSRARPRPTTRTSRTATATSCGSCRRASARLESPCGWLDVEGGGLRLGPQGADSPLARRRAGHARSWCFEAHAAASSCPTSSATPWASSGWMRPTRTATSSARWAPSRRSTRRQDGPRELLVKKRGRLHALRARAPADGRRRVGRLRLPVRVRHREVPAEDGARAPAADHPRDVRRAGASSSARSSRA